jgi:hypothetical protein
MSDNKKRFLELVGGIEREGMDKLIEYVKKSDFFTAPASTRYHGSVPGGLLIHSLNVYDLFERKCNSEPYKDVLKDLPTDSRKIIALFHDLCKTYFYEVDYRNKKIYSDDGSKKDERGRFDWKSVQCYTVNDRVPYGHGEKSVMMIEEFMRLLPIERYAIRWHMGFTEPKESWNALSTAIEKYPVILALHEADLEATYLLEKDLKME